MVTRLQLESCFGLKKKYEYIVIPKNNKLWVIIT